ncbi:MAG: SGNH/GDSL hydrolase family protein [candidate division Zixibacteria bacterium]|nr:SGNH/GDSL hydrolase family protein [candidate division Zixibacteria bacterium]NIR65092.1 SGNH/GDSL hydrolase family protein [candidate division Zixibacteria bacterium]NIS18243.1 SGNH/GDSL hydrolase family protein [candidate division Zixibacteria bacterium]NIS49274.1 SGNH/GDSL hydrolase family protein [candidate division Zixibacteria bacterium]NIT54533.1 SGNH/GDSL hydrolase family protein [candidate division Zixibacteria bacterium]
MAQTETKRLSTGLKILYTLIFIVIVFILFEAALRTVGIHTRRESPFFLLLKVHEYPEYFRRHSTLFWEFIPNKTIKGDFLAEGEYHINNQGFRGEDFSTEKPTDVIRVGCIGNSCTFGWEIPEGKTYPELLELELEEMYPEQDFQVLNLGVPGYTSHQGLVLLKEKVLDFDPDIITLSFGWNDIWGAGKGITDKEQEILSPTVVWLQNILAHLETYKLMKYLILEVTEDEGLESFNIQNPQYRVSQQEYRYNLSQIERIATENGIVPVFLTSPAPDTRVYFGPQSESQLENLFRIHEEYNQVIRQLRDREQFWVAPAATYFKNQSGFFDPRLEDYIHYNVKGHEYVASIIAQYLRRYMIVDNVIESRQLRQGS